ncbi:MAG: TIR domain-containing protein [Nodosilinea sp. LVE1205-7]|jgi:hypothetical protein
MVEQSFDVFLAHSSQDKPLIRQLYRKLKERGINPWLDEEEIAPGTSFQDEIQQAIAQIKTAAICIGQGGLGKWQALELKTFISQCIERNIPVIPVLLPAVIEMPQNLLFLKEFNAVSFDIDMEDPLAYDRLVWGITGQRSQPKSISQIATSNLTRQQIIPTENFEKLDPDLDEDDLSSTRFGITYYAKLRNLLRDKDWKAADEETHICMREVKNISIQGSCRAIAIPIKDIRDFPCQDLRTIDGLWVKYSANSRIKVTTQAVGRVLEDCLQRGQEEHPRY